jgi:thioredoxin-dependent peroxiredoxin
MRRMTKAFLVGLVLGVGTAMAAGPLAVGDAFPAWSMSDHTGKAVSSKDLAGKTYLLWFYPKAQTPGCTAEGRGLRDKIDDFKARGVEVVGVSFDTPEANDAFVKAEGFPFRLLSDGDRALAQAVGAADSKDASHAKRISYLVGPDGRVKQVYASVTPASHAADVLADIPAS